MSRKDIQAKDLQAVLAKDIATKNPIFTTDHITELHALFSLYADPRQRRVDVKDLLMTASTLGLDKKYDIVFRVLHEVADSGDALNFEEFLKALTARIVPFYFTERETHSAKKQEEPTSACMTCKEEENSPSMNSSTSTANSITDSLTNNFGRSSTQSEDSTLRPSPSRDSASTFKRSLCQESLLSDLIPFHLLLIFCFIRKIDEIKFTEET